MAYLPKRAALGSIKVRKNNHYGRTYEVYEAYLGVNPNTKKPVRLTRTSRPALERAIREFYEVLDFGGEDAANLSKFQTADALNAMRELAAAGMDATLTMCARAFIRHGGVARSGVTVGEAYKKYQEEKSHQSPLHADTVRTRVGRWVTVFGPTRPLSDIQAPEVAKDLDARLFDPARPATATTYNNHLDYIKSFLNWCTYPEQAYLSVNPLKGMRSKTKAWTPPEYMKAEDVRRLFAALAATKDTPRNKMASSDLAYAILSFFCGVRPSEIERVADGPSAVAIDLAHKNIRVLKCKGNTRGVQPRSFTIPPQAMAWIESFATRDMTFMEAITMRNKKFREHIKMHAAQLGIKVPYDAGRHTFCTMYDAVHHNPMALTGIVGNDERVRANHYNGLTHEDEGRDFFSILP